MAFNARKTNVLGTTLALILIELFGISIIAVLTESPAWQELLFAATVSANLAWILPLLFSGDKPAKQYVLFHQQLRVFEAGKYYEIAKRLSTPYGLAYELRIAGNFVILFNVNELAKDQYTLVTE